MAKKGRVRYKKGECKYKIQNWSSYNQSLIQRGSLTFWFDEEAIAKWRFSTRKKTVGRPKTYSDLAIECMAALRLVYDLPYRQTQGFVMSILEWLQIDEPTPNYSTLSRRIGSLNIALPRQKAHEPIHLAVDATGLKVYGNGEWVARIHGVSKRRTWRKVHLGINEATGEVLACVVTDKNVHESEVLSDILDQVDEEIDKVSGDGGYDYRDCYVAIDKRDAKPIIPPRKSANIHKHDDFRPGRNDNVCRVKEIGREQWKIESDYHRRSLVETMMYRYKTIIGRRIRARQFSNQVAEVELGCAIINRMTALGMPITNPEPIK